MTLSIIAAIGRDLAIGRRGGLAFHISADLRHFKQLTMGCPVIMGRRTFLSLPKGALPGRRNIVITRDNGFRAAGVETAPSLEAALALVKDTPKSFIIGGGSVYTQAMPLADTLEITYIDATAPDADTFFPPIDPADWHLAAQTPEATDPGTALTYTFRTYTRRR